MLPPTKTIMDPDKKVTHYCSHCTYTSKSSYNIRKHERYVHLKERPLKCNDCECAYAYPRHLLDHRIRIHPDKLTKKEMRKQAAMEQAVIAGIVKCEHCNFETKEKSVLKAHILGRHQNIFHFTCAMPGCTGFRTNILICMKRHLTRSHKVEMSREGGVKDGRALMACARCGAAFVTGKELRLHAKEPHPESDAAAQQQQGYAN